MYHQTPDMDSDFVRAWTLIHELSDQLAHNQKMITTLASQAGLLQVRAIRKPKGHFLGCASDIKFSARRLRLDSLRLRVSIYADSTRIFPKVCVVLFVRPPVPRDPQYFDASVTERFESEGERANAATVVENHTLVQENRQLSLLLKEYEHAMDNIMNKFRSYTVSVITLSRRSFVLTWVTSLQVAAQQHESNIVRHYVTLLAQESQLARPEFANPTGTSMPLLHLSHNLRALIRTMAGRAELDSPRQEGTSEEEAKPDGNPPEELQDTESNEALLALIEEHDWVVDRETEIQRLEAENERLRKMLGIDEASAREHGLLVDEERERDRYLSFGSSSSLSTRSASTSSSFSSPFRPLSLSTSLSASTPTTSPPSTPSTSPGSYMIPRSPRPPPSGLMLNNPPALNLAPPPTLNLLRNPDNQHGGPQQQQQQQHQQQQQGGLGRGGVGGGPQRAGGVFGQRLVGRGGAPQAPWFGGGGRSIRYCYHEWD